MKPKGDVTTKPYYRCFICPRFRNTCGGRPTRDMTLREWCEYIRDIRDYFGLTNSYITEKAESSAKTTEKIMALNTDQDIMRATYRRYEQAVIGLTGEHTCFMDYHDQKCCEEIAALKEELRKAQADAEYWKKVADRNAKIIDKYLMGEV